MGSRALMRMRAEIERDTASGTNDYGHPVKPIWTPITEGTGLFWSENGGDLFWTGAGTDFFWTQDVLVACWAWSKNEIEVIDGKKLAVIELVRMLLPKGTDVTEKDRIANIKDRQGNVLFNGPFGIEAVQYKRQHIELTLKAAAG